MHDGVFRIAGREKNFKVRPALFASWASVRPFMSGMTTSVKEDRCGRWLRVSEFRPRAARLKNLITELAKVSEAIRRTSSSSSTKRIVSCAAPLTGPSGRR